MGELIGYQSGIASAIERLKALDPKGKAAYTKLGRTLKILADEHDARLGLPSPPPAPPPPAPPPPIPPPAAAMAAPQTYNPGSRGQDPRYCTTGLPRNAAGEWYEPSAPGIRYDANGLCISGRTKRTVPGLKPADSMDGKGPCDPYGSFPPWPAASFER